MEDERAHHGGLGFQQIPLRHRRQQQGPPPYPRSGRLRGGGGGGGGGGEIVEVEGGHIVRSTGRKDRHSKVCTSKGPRDRRVRLSAHTAIQFYDVQDRLGYDRPSKAIDWLIKNAKPAIDQLAELPAWTPTAIAVDAAASASVAPAQPCDSSASEQPSDESGKNKFGVDEPPVTAAFSYDGDDGGGGGGGGGSSSFLPPSFDNTAIADTIKSLFPMPPTTVSSPSSSTLPVGCQRYPPGLQDLRLSLQSFQFPIFQHSQPSHHHQAPTPSAHDSLLVGSARSLGWAEQNRQMASWYMPESSSGGGFGEFLYGVPPPQAAPPLAAALGPSQLFSQREPLQSSNSPSVRGWAEPEIQMHPVLHSSVSPIEFTSEAAILGFCIPPRIQGEEEHGSISNRLPSASRH
ncbi:transcription factor PCF5-like [Zingiber officinale]|uniref:TCP domain-containing protein n=1 Tax=Zingiber officinale TaxID=94328 RepID=A0A8J5L548_ZINOF|nr:transcription factor PCF5-like [Zingiber officinale]XP_042388262.1 transcription factor PCF5-like [Zingiber officinale]KAG6506408.1 hypothetical protein ZIOFF_031731 [Zingiber officinale]